MDSEKSYLPYNIFVYRAELCRRRRKVITLNKMKIDITQELIANCSKKLWECDQEDIEAFSRQLSFRDKLLQQQNYLCGRTNATCETEVEESVDKNMEFLDSVNFNFQTINYW
ncbi:PREDICTED: uncharacterized protein LOC108968536 [Bactrocera latifrons]|uniref:uncharacterized protein LOC108968536 n=1 Tax=Bactrocera latifrons TaxID=174628 RepID=UPI0008DE6CCB|nr:PREDICTED: uncharacterized protein LOC108968536 [Bactrocera latifrons]